MSDDFFVDSFRSDNGPSKGLNRRIPGLRWLLLGLLLIFFVLVWPTMAGFYTELLWFRELGYEQVFRTAIESKLALGGGAFLFGTVFIWANLKLALKLSGGGTRLARFITVNKERVEIPDIAGFIERWVLPISLLGGLWLGAANWSSWELFQQYHHRTSFGEADPIFGQDISFYFFTLPLLDLLAENLLQLLVLVLIGVLVLNLMRSATSVDRQGNLIGAGARRHLLVLGAGLALLFAWRAWLAMFHLLYADSGPVTGAGYTDLAVRLPVLKIQVALAIVLALLALAGLFWRSNRLIAGGVAIYVLLLAGGHIVAPSIVQRFSVAPNELVKETPYIEHNIRATRQAFGLDLIEERELSGETTLTRQDIEQNKPTINNIRLWDHHPLLDTFAQIQEIRTYYEFQSVDNDRYLINGELQQTMISPREISIASLPNRNWINERLSFTHGFGLTLGPANQVTPEGLPVLFIKDLPPVTTVPELEVKSPEIYFGELSHEPVYVRTAAQEFNYPEGEQNVYTRYAGTGGVSLGSYWRRLLFATRFGDMKLLLSNDITAESRVLFHRSVRSRLRQIAPFLEFDEDPYMVISGGKLYWIADGYTVSSRYPYAQKVDGINYIRNSVKAVVDPYHGSVDLYISDAQDPVIRTWERILPGAFKPLAAMPADLRSHLRYPVDIFNIQTRVYSTYHMDQPQIFYNKEDQWEVASLQETEGKSKAMSPYYAVMKLPGEEKEEFILMLPFTPRSKDNLASWMVARADGDNYGKLRVYKFPKQRLVYGPKQVVARINQDADVSRQLSLWDQRGSKVILGTLLVIPIRESLIYVQPLYLKAESGKIPELKRVIIVAENRIAMEETLEASLVRIFGEPGASPGQAAQSTPAGAVPVTETASPPNIAAEAQAAYNRAVEAQRAGDWARYGEEIRRLGTLLEQMSRQAERK